MSVHRGRATVSAQAGEVLPPGLVTPALNAVNVHDITALGSALRTALERLSPRPRRVALVLPDVVAKVSLLRFDKVPPKPQDLEQLIRWQVRKATPFRIEDALVSWTDGADVPEGGREYLVEAARRDIVESYERACEAAGVHAGLVDIASTSVVNAVLATQPGATAGDWLLVHMAPDSATLAVVRDGRVIFFRNRPAEGGAQDLGDLVHQTAMYYEDRLGGASFHRVIVSGASLQGEEGDRFRRQINERLGVPAAMLDVTTTVTLRDRITAGPELLDTLAPAVGVLLRERPAGGGEKVA
jgi:Tfp pilus assembly PilM family ATPase